MAYIWGFGKSPDYLTIIARIKLTPNEILTCLSNGDLVIEKFLKFESAKEKRTIKEKFILWDVLNSTIRIPLVNKKVLDILNRECAGKFQAVPAIINLPDGTEMKDYWVINVTNKIECFSLEKSTKYDRFKDDNNLRGFIFSTAAYKKDLIEKEDLCRDSLIVSNLIFISERLYKIFKKEKIKGGGFHESLRDSVIFV